MPSPQDGVGRLAPRSGALCPARLTPCALSRLVPCARAAFGPCLGLATASCRCAAAGPGGEGLCPLSSSPWGSSLGGWRTALDTQCLLCRGDPAHPPPGQFTVWANSTEVFSRIKEYVEFKAWELFPEHLSCSVGAGDGRHLSFELAGGIQPRQWDALSLSCRYT